MRVRLALYGVALCVCFAPILSAQDAAKVDPKHYTVVSENDQVRILKVHYGPHEKSVMHSHPASVACFSPTPRGSSAIRTGKRKALPAKQAMHNTERPPPTCRRTPATTEWM